LYWRALRGKPFAIVRSVEFRVYLALVALVGLVAVLSNGLRHGMTGALVRRTLFTTVSISTTTGYRLANFERWSGSVQLLLIFAMAVGAMAGSTGSGFKVYRLMGIVGHVRRHLFRQLHPRSVPVVRIGHEVVPDAVISRILGFFGLFMGIGAAATIGVAALGGLDLRTAIAAVTTTMGNVGIGLGRLGPGHSFLAVSAGARWVLMATMLIGRLEIYPVLLGLVPLARAVSDRLPPRLSRTLVRFGRG
jgi:trk system potassium uptake protein TrkH